MNPSRWSAAAPPLLISFVLCTVLATAASAQSYPAASTAPAQSQSQSQERSTSRSARTVVPGRLLVDLGIGYPHWVEVRATVGVSDRGDHGWNLGAGFRTFFTNWELVGFTQRELLTSEPFVVAAFVELSGGGGSHERSSLGLEGGVAGSLLVEEFMVVTAHASLALWSDRLCATGEGGAPPVGGPSVCTAAASQDQLSRASMLVGRTVTTPLDLQDRDNGARLKFGVVAEVAVSDHIGIYVGFDGVPFQSERARFTDLFNHTLFEEDPRYELRAGVTVGL